MTAPDYCTVARLAEVENIIQKSRFIGRCFPIQNEEEALLYLEQVRKGQWDASHHCYAYITGERGQIARFSDDGEPSGTAGMPMLDVLKKRRLENILVVITRYFGGVLLGSGGLVRAYSTTTSDACKSAGLVYMRWSEMFDLEMDYSLWGKVQHFLLEQSILVIDTAFTDLVMVTVCIPKSIVENFLKAITEKTDGRIVPVLQTAGYHPWLEDAAID